MNDDDDRLTLRQRRAIDKRLAATRRNTHPHDGYFWVFVSLIVMAGIITMAYGLFGCIEAGDKQFNTTSSQPVKIDASEQLISAKLLEDARIKAVIKAEVSAQVAAQINQVGGNQIQNSTWALLALIVWPGVLQLADKISRRFKTFRRIDAAVKGVPKVTVSE